MFCTVLKRAKLVEDVDAEVVDEGIIIIDAVQLEGHPIFAGQAIGRGIFVVVEQSACVQTLYHLYRMSNWSFGRCNLTQGCFPGLLQHL